MLRRLQKCLCAILLLALMVPALCPAMASGIKATLNTTSRVYKKASTDSESVKVREGTRVTVKAVEGKWAQITRDGKTGYIPVKYLDSAERRAVYASKDTYVYKSPSSSSGKKFVAMNTKLYVVGQSGDYYRVENAGGTRAGYIKTSCVSDEKVKETVEKDKNPSWKDKVVKMDWSTEGKNVLKKGSYGYIYDIKTGITVKIKRMGGHNHMDVEPATAADTRKLLRVAGGKFSWDSHAVILMSRNKYVASAINTLPHGDQTIHDNNYEGQFCLHTSNSLTHGSGKINKKHQAAIEKAYRWAHEK